MNHYTQETITELAKEHGWSEVHTKALRDVCHNVCASRLRAYIATAPVGLSPTNISCQVHGYRPCNSRALKEKTRRHIGYAVRYEDGPNANKFWGRNESGHWICSSSPFVFVREEDADRAVDAQEGCQKKKSNVFVEEDYQM